MRDARLRLASAGRAVELHRPTLLVGSVCAGLALANVVVPDSVALVAFALGCVGGLALLERSARTAALALVLATAGLWWGSLRLDALAERSLASRIGE